MVGISLWVQLVAKRWLAGGGRVSSGSSSRGCWDGVVLATSWLGQARSSSGALTTEGSTNGLWLASESISTLLTSTERSTVLLELGHGDGWKGSSGVVLSLVMVHLVDWDGGVDDGWLDSLLLDDWLDILVDVVVDVLASNRWSSGVGVLSLTDLTSVLEGGLLSSESLLYVIIVAVVDVAGLNTRHLVNMLLWEDLLVLDWLNGGVVVVLVYLTVNGSGGLLVLSTGDVLVGHSWVDSLVNGGVMLAILGKERVNCLLGLLHFDDVCMWLWVVESNGIG